LALKNRSYHKGLILVASDLGQAAPYLAPLSPTLVKQINSSKNKHITWLLPARGGISPLLCGDFPASSKKMAIRITSFPLIKALCEQLTSPIVSTSANLSGRKMTYSVLQIRQQFHNNLDLILNGKLGEQSSPSEIRDALSGKLIRSKV